MKRPTHDEIREFAKMDNRLDDELEIDDKPKISADKGTDTNGCFVQCWMWVDFDNLRAYQASETKNA